MQIGFETDLKFVIPFRAARFANLEIDWGDGSPHCFVTEVGKGYAGRKYPAKGAYRVKIYPYNAHCPTVAEDPADVPCWLDHLGMTDREAPVSAALWTNPFHSIQSWGSLGIRSLRSLFCGSEFNGSLPSYGFHTVRDMSYMFMHAVEFNQPSNTGTSAM